jgi:hypothetical protein
MSGLASRKPDGAQHTPELFAESFLERRSRL